MILANLKHSVVPTALVSALLLAGCVSPAVTQQVRGHIDSSMEAAGVMNRSLRVEESTQGHKTATNAAAARQLAHRCAPCIASMDRLGDDRDQLRRLPSRHLR